MNNKLTYSNTTSWLDAVWDVLEMARNDLIPEGNPAYDNQWSDVCTAMAWIQDALNVEEMEA